MNPLYAMLQHRSFAVLLAILAGMAFLACSTKKDAFLNRNWHALNTKYNVLYNGNLAFDEGREELNANYKDDYWEVLPVERHETTDEVKLDSEDNNPNFIIAEEKATKAIQKHSMDIRDVERNPQTDEAFLLLGKARYFDHRYIPALEAFNYILRKYDESDKLNEAHIWREKVNIRLENEELAIKNLKRLFKYEELKDQEYADARAMMAQAYINLNHPDSAIQQLKIASYYTRENPEKGRYYYIIGQLFDRIGHQDSANYAFDKVIALNRKSPRIYMINAEIEKLRNTEVTSENEVLLLEYLTDLEENRENRPFLDKIFRQLAEYHLDRGSDSLALDYFNKSLRATQAEPKLNAMNYGNLAEYNFDQNSYKTAGAYYDSVLINLPENSREYRTVKKKLDNLEDVIAYEDVVQYTDSVISLYRMSEDERQAYFEAYIQGIKEAEAKKAEEQERRQNAGFAAFAESKGGKENRGKFYFYNITSLGYGKNEFRSRWGNRELEDNWRWSNKSRTLSTESTDATVAGAEETNREPTEDERYSVAFYTSRIPSDDDVIDSLVKERNFANYQLGLIYKEKFKENTLAAGKLEDVLRSRPEERLILPSKYNLYKIYEEEGSPLLASMKNDILTNHPDSRYAEILLNPRAVLEEDSDSPEARYAVLYEKYRRQEFLATITGAEENISNFTGDPMIPKFEMLKANAIGRLQGFQPFRDALNYVALTYPNSPEGKKAEQMVVEQLPKLENKEFSPELESTGTDNWKVVFQFKRRQDEAAVQLVGRLRAILEDLKYSNIVSRDIYDLENQFVIVHGFKSRDFALGFSELLKINKDYSVDYENFVILSTNYKIIQVHKNLQEYNNQMLTPKP